MDQFVSPFVCVVDTREQAPWYFSDIVIEGRLWLVRRKVATLATGDYSIEGYESRVCIERKSAGDLVKSVTVEHEREKRKAQRMRKIQDSGGFARYVIEGDLSRIVEEIDDPNSGRKITGYGIIACQASWELNYVPWSFAGDRRTAEILAFTMMLKWWTRNR
jgi:ERCC4-type nuclease